LAIEQRKNFLLRNDNFVKAVTEKLGYDAQTAAERFAPLIEKHCEEWGDNYFLFSSPGRIEVCGNHTDHNNGKVIAAAVTADTIAVVTPLEGSKVVVKSVGYPAVEVDISDLTVNPKEEGTSHALVRGVAKGFADRGYKTGGFAATTSSQVFKGAGMSSSASFEVLVSEIFNALYNSGSVPAVQKAIISQYAENVYFGKPSGLMDQAAIALGGISYIDFKDTSAPEVYNPDWDFKGLSVVVVNCGGDHCDLTPQYAAIRYEMEAVAGLLGQKKLRFADERSFYSQISSLRESVSDRAILRAMHFFEENGRVDALAKAIDTHDFDKAMALITQSGDSSYKKLQNCYPEGETSQPIPLALAMCQKFDGVKAYRVHGGGFAGTILTFVDSAKKEEFAAYMSAVFGKENVFAVGIRSSGTCKII
jgi:galactokinase